MHASNHRCLVACLYAMALLLPIACSSPNGKFHSKRDATYKAKLERLLIVHFGDDKRSPLGDRFSEQLSNELLTLLASRQIAAEVVGLDRTALDRNAPLRTAATRFRPQHILYLGVTSVNRNTSVHQISPSHLPHYTSETAVGLEFNLVDAQKGNAFWRSQVNFYAIPRPKDVAAQLMEELAATGFLR